MAEGRGPICSSLLRVPATLKAILMFSLMVIMACVVSCFRCLHRCCGYRNNRISPTFYEDWFSFNLGWSALRTFIRDIHNDLICNLRAGSDAPNIELLTLDGVPRKLFDFQRNGRPLVINFGSCS